MIADVDHSVHLLARFAWPFCSTDLPPICEAERASLLLDTPRVRCDAALTIGVRRYRTHSAEDGFQPSRDRFWAIGGDDSSTAFRTTDSALSYRILAENRKASFCRFRDSSISTKARMTTPRSFGFGFLLPDFQRTMNGIQVLSPDISTVNPRVKKCCAMSCRFVSIALA